MENLNVVAELLGLDIEVLENRIKVNVLRKEEEKLKEKLRLEKEATKSLKELGAPINLIGYKYVRTEVYFLYKIQKS